MPKPLSYLGLVYMFTTKFGPIGAMYTFLVNDLGHLAFNLVVARRYLEAL